ncbi:hybrid sensor histidine kinase/response regulator transcription factor [Pelagicoccus sp. SDUM812005]|uniref:hybrid sensor histidine kinase/response regulator transcription factor n=1 Tax=Pelagicoccus sp. SDUM812005 TaxID=3041257 RepID=UPI00280E03D5|nr:hybrid sensor histidine kinase/response regulator transcription factor [Pelagicoccus sp. SDUM812005]MDQ8183505.1 hybrid sensor histidine kinase/response regulator transcription factor [Pelagicoccus sp. SDUM812005]
MPLLIGGSLAFASQVYFPERLEPIGEAWRWTDVEALGPGSIRCFDAPKSGAVWVGIGNELVRYDGREMQRLSADGDTPWVPRAVKETERGEVYLLSRQELHRFSGGEWKRLQHVGPFAVRRMQEDADGRVWFASRGAIFSALGEEVVMSRGIAAAILDIEFDQSGQLWALDAQGSVVCCETEDGVASVKRSWQGTGGFPAGRLGRVGMIEVDSEGIVWFVDSNPQRAPRSYDPRKDVWEEVDLRKAGGNNVNYSILEPQSGRLLISGNESISYRSGADWASISNANLRLTDFTTYMSLGRDGQVWFVQSNSSQGRSRLARVDYSGRRWKDYANLNFQCEWGEGRLCFLTKKGEFVIHDTARGEWELFSLEDGLIDNPLVALLSAKGEIWIAGSHENEAAVNQFDGEKWIRHDLPELGEIVSRFGARSFSDGSLLFACGQETTIEPGKGGIVRFRPQGEGYVKERLEDTHNRIIAIQEDSEGNLLYSKDRIFRYGEDTFSGIEVPRKHRVSWIDEFHTQSDGKLWFCNWGQGVHYFDGSKWRMFTESDGLSSIYVSNLMVQKDGTVLALTAKGLDRYQHGQWQNVKGPAISGIREGTTLRSSSDGSVWVNLASRSWYFRKNSRENAAMNFRSLRFKPDALPPETRIVSMDERSKYSDTAYISWTGVDPWSETPQIDLLFSYQLDQGRWSPFSKDASTHFSELEPGDHRLRVRALDQDGNVDTSPAVLSFTVYAPFWETPWFVATAVAVPIIVIGLIILLLAQRIRHMAELDGLRTRFLMNISHELRSPLSLIMLPLEKFIQEHGIDENSKGLATALRSTRRLNQLVEQLLELHKAKAQKYKLNPKAGDVVRYTRAVVADFDSLASSRNQTVQFSCKEESYLTRFDEDIYRKILDNLVLNAIKHSPANSEVTVTLEKGEDSGLGTGQLRLVVEDNGAGIQPNVLKRIFEPFYNNSENSSQRIRSFGIGLALVKELVDFCQATIAVESPVKDSEGRRFGSRFTIEFSNMPEFEAPQLEAASWEANEPEGRGVTVSETPATLESESDRAVVLLVDDHNELREYIAEELAVDFTVIEAEGSREGIDLATEKVPDLIIADVMMPEMDGIAFCRALKENAATSHIPVILQTSLASEEKEVASFEAGAIDYLTKPTSVTLLKKRIQSHLDAGKRHAKFLRTQLLEPEAEVSAAVNDSEAELVKRIRSVVEQNWSQPDFNTDMLASEIGMSRSSFYLKCKAITNVSPAEAIKSYRLAKAKELLSSGKSVAEVATLVGYLETSSFYRAFKKRFNCTPSEFQKQARN